jgi:hypothetical protein
MPRAGSSLFKSFSAPTAVGLRAKAQAISKKAIGMRKTGSSRHPVHSGSRGAPAKAMIIQTNVTVATSEYKPR